MKDFDQQIFEKLISDRHFIGWVRGEVGPDADSWNSWEKEHPSDIEEFREAIRIVKDLHFRGAELQKADIHYLWTKTADRIHNSGSPKGIRYFYSQLTKIAALLLLPVLIVSGWLYHNQQNLTQKYANLFENKHEQNVNIVAPIGSRIKVDLPDGSTAWLNSGSQLTYPMVFDTKARRVKLIGEAYFKVHKDQVPFYVSNLGPEIKVYGTEFNVNSYTDENEVIVALKEGKISLDLINHEEFLAPGQVSVYDRKKNNITIEDSDADQYGTWREGKYILRDKPLSAILRILQRLHNVNIHLSDPSLGNYQYNATINNESLEQILKLLSLSAPIKYTYKHRSLNPDGSWEPDQVEISRDKTRIVKPKI